MAYRKRKQELREPGDLIQMDNFQREFLELRGKYVENKEMELEMAADTPSGKNKMSFGSELLFWEQQLTAQDFKHLEQAKKKHVYPCRNEQCQMHNKDVQCKLDIVMHQKEVPHTKLTSHGIDKLLNKLYIKMFGIKRNVCFHVAAICPHCKKFVKYVKYSLSNRRAAADPRVSGPHQKRTTD